MGARIKLIHPIIATGNMISHQSVSAYIKPNQCARGYPQMRWHQTTWWKNCHIIAKKARLLVIGGTSPGKTTLLYIMQWRYLPRRAHCED